VEPPAAAGTQIYTDEKVESSQLRVKGSNLRFEISDLKFEGWEGTVGG
jgi:hypothetical protein